MITDDVNEFLFKKHFRKTITAIAASGAVALLAAAGPCNTVAMMLVYPLHVLILFCIWIVIDDVIHCVFQKRMPGKLWLLYAMVLAVFLVAFYYLTNADKLLLLVYASILSYACAKGSAALYDYCSRRRNT